MRIAFDVPGKPVGKGRARSTRTGRHYTDQRTVNAESWVRTCFLEAAPEHVVMDGPRRFVYKTFAYRSRLFRRRN